MYFPAIDAVAQYSLLFDIGIIVILAAALSYIFRLLRQPSIIAYVMTGIILGPFGLSLITNQGDILTLSELGIAFLLFMAGIELDISKLREVGKVATVTASMQMAITFAVGYWISMSFNYGGLEAFYLGLAVAFSSTMAVVKILSDKRKIDALRGRISIGILLMQDIVIILALSFMSKLGITMSAEILAQTAMNGLGLIAIAVVLGKFVLPPVLKSSATNRELFFLVSVATAFFFIGLSSFLGFSIAIGGFIGGLALATYPFNVEIRNKIIPLRDFFTVIFFSSLGMQLNLALMGNLVTPFLLFMLVLILLKPIIITTVLSFMGYGSKIPILVGLGLAQGSEFVFVLADKGMKMGHISDGTYSLIISLVLLSIMVTPYLHRLASKLADIIASRYPQGFISSEKVKHIEKMEDELEDHIVLLGADRAGMEVLREVSEHGHAAVVVDHNPEVVEEVKDMGHNAIYGEVDSKEILKRVNVKDARMVVSTIPGFETNQWLVKEVKRINENVVFICKTRDKRDALNLYRTGADLVILPEQMTGDRMAKEVERVEHGDMDLVKEIRNEKMKEINEEMV